MIPIGPHPILWHLMRYYAHYGHDDFILCTGYKSEVVKEYFLNLEAYSSDFTIDFSRRSGDKLRIHERGGTFAPRVTIAYTGLEAMTGSRVKQISRYLDGEERFLLTYGDGLTDIDLGKLIAFHNQHGKIATLSAVFPPAKFGDLRCEGDLVTDFAEKKGKQGAMVNGGFYVFDRRVFEYLEEDLSCILENEALSRLSSDRQLMAYRHTGYWQCMDTTRDLEHLQQAWLLDQAPWKVWSDGYCN